MQSNKDDEKSFQKAFDYFFDLICHEEENKFYESIKEKLHQDSSFILKKTKFATKFTLKKNISINEIRAKFIESLGAEASYSAIHLNMMFESSIIKTFFSVYDSIIQYKDNNKFPEELENGASCSCYFKGGRDVNIVLSHQEKLGLTFDIDGQQNLPFITNIFKGSAVDRTGCIKEGDFVLKINNIDTKFKNFDELTKLLTISNDNVISLFVDSCLEKKEINNEFPYFCRALVNFSPNSFINDQGLSSKENILYFSKGDILQVFGSVDDNWLKAKFIGRSTLIYVEDSSYLNDSIPFNLNNMGLILKDPVSEENDNYISEKYGLKFEKLLPVFPCNYIIRCILFVGPNFIGRSELKKKLISSFPHKYANVVPHTTRPRRNHEVDGIDYYFVDRLDLEEKIYSGNCIEHGEYNNNLYGTTYDTILDVMNKGQTPVLSVNPKTILKLRNTTFKPLLIFIKPPDILTLKETRSKPVSVKASSFNNFSDMDFKEMIANSSLLQRNFGGIVDELLVNGDFDESYKKLCLILESYEKFPQFVPQKWVDWI